MVIEKFRDGSWHQTGHYRPLATGPGADEPKEPADPTSGRPGAVLDEAELIAWMSEHIARYKVPKRVFFWDALPKSGYGKVPKRLVRDELEARGLLKPAAGASA